ncbi:MAG TPA: OmpA family protein, partial [Acidobacteriaceae bacterium]|nr:OmpA family protein [Acidobacteriaceae bacterium]
ACGRDGADFLEAADRPPQEKGVILMDIQHQLKSTCGLALSMAMFASLGVVANAQDTAKAGGQQATIQGLVIGRDGQNMSVKTADTPKLTVVLSDSTKATEKGGFLGLSRKDLGITQLVPGMQVKVEGSYDPNHELVAKKITFSRSSYETAQQIDAGLNPTNEKVAAAQDQLRSDRKDIEAGQSDLASAKQDIDATKQGLAANVEATGQNKQAIGQTNTRIGTLDQYDTKDTLTVNFANGRSTVTKKNKEALTDFVKQAADTPGAMIEVQGYASKVGGAALNQKLSSERATNVLTIIQQAGVPLTRILAPAAMGTTEQVADNHTRSGQAQNRRVVVTIVVNKGITNGASGETASNTTGGL